MCVLQERGRRRPATHVRNLCMLRSTLRTSEPEYGSIFAIIRYWPHRLPCTWVLHVIFEASEGQRGDGRA